jgi:cardiolipin synthase (CMP-forming)
VSEGQAPRRAHSDLTLANVFTGARLILIPIFGYLWATGDNLSALWIFGVAVGTDLVDGFLARTLNQESRLGAFLDPVADKLLVLVALLVGIRVGAVPVWLAVCVVARDLMLVVGFGALGGRRDPEMWRPTRIGKYAMLFQSLSIVTTIIDRTIAPRGLRAYVQAVMVAAAATTIIAGVQYAVRGHLAMAARRQVRQGGPP